MAKSMFTMPFGKFVGHGIEDLEDWYLEFLLEQDWFCKQYPKGVKAIETELKYREKFSEYDPEEDTKWNRR